jgi:hypothetical protein
MDSGSWVIRAVPHLRDSELFEEPEVLRWDAPLAELPTA